MIPGWLTAKAAKSFLTSRTMQVVYALLVIWAITATATKALDDAYNSGWSSAMSDCKANNIESQLRAQIAQRDRDISILTEREATEAVARRQFQRLYEELANADIPECVVPPSVDGVLADAIEQARARLESGD